MPLIVHTLTHSLSLPLSLSVRLYVPPVGPVVTSRQCGSHSASGKRSEAGIKACRTCAQERRGNSSYLQPWPMEKKGKVAYLHACMLVHACTVPWHYLLTKTSQNVSCHLYSACVYVKLYCLEWLSRNPILNTGLFSNVIPLFLTVEHVTNTELCPGKNTPLSNNI